MTIAPEVSVRRERSAAVPVVVAAAMAPLLVWLVADPLLGARLEVITPRGAVELGAPPILIAGVLSALAGWGLRGLLDRFAPRRGRTIWVVAAVLVLALSCLPLTDPAISTSTRLWLGLMHVVVGAVLIPGLGRRRDDRHAAGSRGRRSS
ncbi:DUF6069 family protein [Streptomyces sp. NPDC054847]